MKNKYLIGEVSQYLDISKDTLRFYDKKGIISPIKDSDNGYRYYTNDDIIKLTYLIILKGLEVNLDEIKKLLNRCTLEEVKVIIEEKQTVIEERLITLNKIKETLANVNEDIEQSLRLTNEFEIINCPKFIFKSGDDNFNYKLMKEIKKLEAKEKVNAVYYTSIISSNYFKSKSLECNIFNGVSGKINDISAEVKAYEDYKIYNNIKCIHTIIRIRYEICEEDLDTVYRYIKDNKLIVTGDTLGRFVTFENRDGKAIDYVELWIPIE